MSNVYIAHTDCLDDERIFAKLYSEVSDFRRNKIDSMRHKNDKILSLAAGTLLRKALELQGRDPDSFSIAADSNGKPFFAGETGMYFNLSHSGNSVMCALSEKPVGCDVEQIKKIDMKIAKRFFHVNEYNSILSCDTEKQNELFFRYWTLKESFMKATGFGFGIKMSDFEIVIGDQITVRQNLTGDEYYFKEYNISDNCKYAVCALSPDFSELNFVDIAK